MKNAARLFIIILTVFVFSFKSQAQTSTIDAIIFSDLSTIDLATFASQKDIINQQRIFQVVIMPQGQEITVEVTIVWKKFDSPNFEDLVSFHTYPFSARNFYNDEIDQSEIKINTKNYNSSLLSDLVALGKPGGTFKILLQMFDAEGKPIADNFNSSGSTLVLLNPTAPSIQLPLEGSTYDVGSILVQWTQSLGAASYKVLANYLDEGQSPEQALSSSDLLVNNYDVGNVNTVDFRDILNKELLNGKNIAVVVKAIVPRPGGQEELSSPIVTFKTNPIGADSTMIKAQIDPNILQLADFLSGKVNQGFIDDLKDGKITMDEIQISDENNNSVPFNDLIDLITFLSSNEESLISVIYSAN